jgi:catechol 2,3-dioxygenase
MPFLRSLQVHEFETLNLQCQRYPLVGYKMLSSMRIGSPVLRVRSIDKILAFYEKKLGLHVKRIRKDNDGNPVYELGFVYLDYPEESLLQLHHDPNARNATPHSAGLFHFAILVPNRESLASTYLALKNSGVHYDGFADHLVSESLYLRDLENNGIEVYRDRPAKDWPRDSEGNIMMDTLPLNLQSIVSEMDRLESENPIAFPTGARIGHMHLKVTNLERSVRFYHEILGLDITVDWTSMGAAFLSAGGYHHHIGMNTWHSMNGEVHSNDVLGLENFTITIPDTSSFNRLRSAIKSYSIRSEQQQRKQKSDENQFMVSDPDGIQIVIRSE